MTEPIITPQNTTVVICCAGMGTRLGIGATKALVDVCGEPLILRRLRMLDDFDDVRIVVGFQAQRVIDVVNAYRKDVMFVFNYDYETTGVADSLRKALTGARAYVLSLDGDTLDHPADFARFAACGEECIPVSRGLSSTPVLARVEDGQVTALAHPEGTWRWPGTVKMRREAFGGTSPHVYEMIAPRLPVKAFPLRSREIDTPEDYDAAVAWFEKGCED